jgi:hypothetical protein
MNVETGRANTSQAREKDRRRCLSLWVLVGLLTITATGLALLIP